MTPKIDLKQDTDRTSSQRRFLVPLPVDANGITATAAVASKEQADALARLIAFATADQLRAAGFVR